MTAQKVDLTATFIDLEQQLSAMLNPVQPSPEFVSHLRYRLANPTQIELEMPRKGLAVYVALAIGLFTGMLFWWIFRRLR